MTLEELVAAFPLGIVRDPWEPGQYAAYARLRNSAADCARRANDLYAAYWWRDDPATGTALEAQTVRAAGMLDRAAGLLMLDAARVAECGLYETEAIE